MKAAEYSTDEELLEYSERFLGFGDLRSPFWFITSGPSFPRQTSLYDDLEYSEIREKYERERDRLIAIVRRWSEDRPRQLDADDLAAYGLTDALPYRRAVSIFAHVLRERALPRSPILTNATPCDVFRAEFLPLSPHAMAELGSPRIFDEYRRSKAHFAAYRRMQRLHLIRSSIVEFRPRIVCMFGSTYAHFWSEIPKQPAGVRWRIRGPIEHCRLGPTTFVMSPAPQQYYAPPGFIKSIAASLLSLGGI